MAWRGRVGGWLRGLREVVADDAGQTEALAPVVPEDDVDIDAFRAIELASRGYAMAFVDVRDEEEIGATGAVEGALRAPLGVVLSGGFDVPDDVEVLVFYCDSGRRSLEAARHLRRLGCDLAWSLSGGIAAWRREGGGVDI